MLFEQFQSAHRRLLEELYGGLPARAWGLSSEAFRRALWKSAEKARLAEREIAAFLRGLHARDLALAAACAEGSETAWNTFVEEQRGPLQAAGRLLAGDRGEELAGTLFGELYTERQAKLGSYGGRSSLAGWLRAVLYQAHVDRLRKEKRLVSLDAETQDGPACHEPAAVPDADPVEESEYVHMARGAMESALRALPPRQKLLLDFYYFQGLTLREAAALVDVHEATASRELDRARARLKKLLTEILRRDYRLGDQEIRDCLYRAAEAGWSLGVTESRVQGPKSKVKEALD